MSTKINKPTIIKSSGNPDKLEISLSEKDFPTIKKQNPTPKEALKKFILENVENEPYIVTIFEDDTEEGYYFLHRMRNELSRLRSKLIERGQVIKKFKILCKSVIINDDGTCSITIMRTNRMESKSDDDLDDMLDKLAL